MAFVSKKDEAYREYALNASPIRVLLSSCAPLALYQALQSIFKVLDAMMASHIGSDAASAVACLNQITLMITALGTGLATGGTIKISEAYGRGDYELVRKQVSAVYTLAVTVGLVIMGVLIPFAVPFLRLLNTAPELIETGVGYFRVEILTVVVTFFNTVYLSIERSRGHAKKILVLNVIIILVKLGLTALFVYVLGKGVTMIAVATLIGQLGVMGYAIVSMFFDDGAFRFRFKSVNLGGKIILPILNLAYPVSAEKVLFAGGKVTVNAMSTAYGPTTVGALGISNNIGGLTTSWQMGFTDGASPLISQNRGAGKYRRTLQIYFRLLAIDILIGVVGVAVVSFTLPYLANIFAMSKNNFDPAFRDTIVSIHQWEMLGYITLGINSATVSLLLGYGYTKLTFLLNVARVFAFRVPVLWFFQNFTKVGVEAVGMTMMISNICVGISAIAVAIPVVMKISKLAKAEQAMSQQ